MTERYGSLAAELYDLAYPIGTSFGDLEYYRDRLQGTDGRILEPAVGTGRLLIPLMESGLVVEGYDLSAAMLAVCRRHGEERGLTLTVFEADMARFVDPEAYEVIMLPAGSFALVEDSEDAEAALAAFHASLLPGGRLILDLDPPPFAPDARPSRVHTGPDDTVITMDTLSRELDPVRQVCTRYLRYEKWQGGAWISAELHRFPLRWYGLNEFRQFLSRAGFTNIIVSGDYRHGIPPTEASQAWTFEAVRA